MSPPGPHAQDGAGGAGGAARVWHGQDSGRRLKYGNTVGLGVALEALKEPLSTRNAAADELWLFAKVCRVANVIRPYLEALAQAVP